jgi:hypothetical protein
LRENFTPADNYYAHDQEWRVPVFRKDHAQSKVNLPRPSQPTNRIAPYIFGYSFAEAPIFTTCAAPQR